MSGQRVAVLTGARRGLGAATAEALARLGHHVVITARDEAAATATAARLAAAGLSAEGRALDVADDSSVAALFAWLSGAWGRIDVLVNNAGAFFEGTPARDPARAFDVPAATVAAAFEANTLGAYRTMQRAVPLMNAAGYGRVVNVSSGLGGLAEMGGGYPAYRASKAAMNALTRIFHAAAWRQRQGQLGVPRVGADGHGWPPRDPQHRGGDRGDRVGGDTPRRRPLRRLLPRRQADPLVSAPPAPALAASGHRSAGDDGAARGGGCLPCEEVTPRSECAGARGAAATGHAAPAH